ncbi:unnamed protein product [Chironomus riparius]|uniref:Uncharacterized protein n=1 Tax=Chironomus riparius TaxID=315576 RepID=A0A9N9RUV2_9DIPT|nr:unnamed protein product [Chironomus riparius]
MRSKMSYYNVRKAGCRLFNDKILALLSGIYTLNISILIFIMFGWQINANFKSYQDLGDVYYGIQIAQIAIIGTQISMAILSVVLIIGIYKENSNFLVPYIVGFLTLWSLETIALLCGVVTSDSDDSETTSTTMSIYFDENENRLVYPYVNSDNNSDESLYQTKVHWHDPMNNTEDSELDLDARVDDEKILGDGSDEDDSLLVIYHDLDTNAAY